MTVYEADIPGVGRKFEVELADGTRAVVVHHHDGRRELFKRSDPEADSEQVFDLSAERARQLGSILTGAHFESVDTAELSVPLGDAIIVWVTVPADSPLVGETLVDRNVRAETGVSVVALQRGEETIANPRADTVVEPDDVLVALGTRTEQQAFEDLVDGTDPETGDDESGDGDDESGDGDGDPAENESSA